MNSTKRAANATAAIAPVRNEKPNSISKQKRMEYRDDGMGKKGPYLYRSESEQL